MESKLLVPDVEKITPFTDEHDGARRPFQARTDQPSHMRRSATPSPLERRLSLKGWAVAGGVSLLMWGIIIYLAMKLL